MSTPIRILLQTTIPTTADDWHIGRFSLLRDHLASLRDERGAALYDVVARDRSTGGDDPVLSTLDASDVDQLWLFAVDTGNGLTTNDCGGISRFRQRGGGLLVARDHEDLGSSVCTLGGVGAAHHFHSKNPEPPERCTRDDTFASNISWPNYHSGQNGDLQVLTPVGELHPVLRSADGSAIRELPAHPHEGAVSAPPDRNARVIATGRARSPDTHSTSSSRSNAPRQATGGRWHTPASTTSSTTTGRRRGDVRASSPTRSATELDEGPLPPLRRARLRGERGSLAGRALSRAPFPSAIGPGQENACPIDLAAASEVWSGATPLGRRTTSWRL